jgi:hypothetical protein
MSGGEFGRKLVLRKLVSSLLKSESARGGKAFPQFLGEGDREKSSAGIL